MSLTCGFFNAVLVDGKPDRLYNTSELSSLVDGIIRDGIFMSIGEQLRVTAGDAGKVYVGEGKAWFNHTWTTNDAPLEISCESADASRDRIDAIVLEVNSSDAVRSNSIKYIKGEPNSKPVKPQLEDSTYVHQYALCYINRPANSGNTITQANIENMVGTGATPFVSGILETIDIDELLGQWRAQLDEFVADETAELDANLDELEEDYRTRLTTMNARMEKDVTDTEAWTAAQQEYFENWLSGIIGQLSSDQAGNLQLQIDRDEIKQVLHNGFADGVTNISSDGTVITSEDSSGRTLTTTFTNNFLTITKELKSREGVIIGTLVKHISADGSTITSTIDVI